ncbi:efflux RND transporter permease subunit [Chitinophaga ginsengisoli]|uniref:Multidrug efflux pump subunit AcrB n=1 Tax=Chitinophaga ginsengisoli TaxID=363837 RepID=A0A2P8FRT7_9BACT|nr:efflux RND transporter permease subunit [Chitinophaga ginsengisoli]PSL24441.1 multidrug efflux pump subunit AcrB [Chitinophaga ginsengisoli]
MIAFLTKRPIAVLISFFALMLLGIVAGNMVPTSLLPDTDIPQINIRIQVPNQSAREIEQNITSTMRDAMRQLHSLDAIESASGEGSGDIQLVFTHGTDMSMAFIAVNEKVDMLMNRLPPGTARPLVTRVSVSDIPVFHLQLYDRAGNESPQRLAEISSFTREIVRRRLEQSAEISMVDITGYTAPQVQLQPREDYLRTLGLNAGNLLHVFQENKISLGNVMVRDGHYRYYLKFVADLHDLDDIRQIPLQVNGRIFRLDELSAVSLNNAPATGAFYTNGHRAIDMAIIKQSAARMEDLQQSFQRLVAQFRQDYPDMQFRVSQDQTALLNYAVGNLYQDLVLGGMLAFICMMIFIRKPGAAILVGITIPVSLVLSQLGFYLFGISFNVISLGGLILGLGMIIDNSIVVIDTITLHRLQGKSLEEASVAGPNEIIIPLISSVLTNCAVFVPLLFLSGLAGAIFFDQALSITIGIVASMLVSVLLLPPLFLLIHRLRPFREDGKHQIPALVNVTGWYEKGIHWVFKHITITVMLVLGVMLTGIFCFLHIKKERLPPISRQELDVQIDWNGYADPLTANARVDSLLQPFRAYIERYSVWTGAQQYLLSAMRDMSSNQARIYIRLKKSEYLPLLVAQLPREAARHYPAALVEQHPAENAFDAVFADRQAPLVLQLSEKDSRTMPAIRQSEVFRQRLGYLLPGVPIAPIAHQQKLVLRTNTELASLYGVSLPELNNTLSNALKPLFVDNFQGTKELVPIVITSREYPSLQDLLIQTTVKGKKDQQYPLANFVSTSPDDDYRLITAGKQGEYYPIRLEVSDAGSVLDKLGDKLVRNNKEFSITLAGSYFDNQALIRQMSFILLISVVLLYFILSVQFESLLQPLFILAELPIAILGAFIFLDVAGSSLNLMSMIGIVIMSGLVINDSILKIDAINSYRRQGVPLIEAIHLGGLRRLKPMVMISLSTVGALLPTLFMRDLGSELQKPLSLTLLGGMTLGLLVSLFFVPLLYWLIYRGREKHSPKAL